ncbi:hypothetical protein HDV00_002278 [Rhizophlyctis rosea]|nr:hypothetical protein HDV00_002278 [Rhizophlyctis rosea]
MPNKSRLKNWTRTGRFLRHRKIVGDIIREQAKTNEEAQDRIFASQLEEGKRLCKREDDMVQIEENKVAVLLQRKEKIERKVEKLKEQKAIREQIAKLTQEARELEKEGLEMEMQESLVGAGETD